MLLTFFSFLETETNAQNVTIMRKPYVDAFIGAFELKGARSKASHLPIKTLKSMEDKLMQNENHQKC